ncbi:MOSC domain-containing protein [Marinobacter sp. M216]|uniref:MOSC domain-containing protein n=1 Tax=Marinobacter albus TaxID=3030833 RepID=A0ABT7HCM7_9GAMM|nr:MULTISPECIES: MOSC N-terminal beta barrel domain-containing protein [unclassified Marinobacter]MBW7469624.1 MOSC domain-containing protein [Marinobacter sp. F4218]MDK9558107.1 MOSC domain-containing protein [Marinobacter sp. M216]
MNVHSLWIYPVKSLAGIAVGEFALDDFGPVGDRRWMIIDDDRHFVTQRNHPELARIRVYLVQGNVEVEIPEQGRYALRVSEETLRALVWRDWTQALVGQAEASEALSRFCGKSLRFVYMPDESFRRVDAARLQDLRRVSFADGFPLLITNLASLEELNGRLDEPVEMRRFRPNIVVEGAGPWAEDHWRALNVGDNAFDLVKPCSRCVMTTVDPDAGTKDASVQPLRTLSRYRRTEDGVIFGMNAIHESIGRIRVGDPVKITKTE